MRSFSRRLLRNHLFSPMILMEVRVPPPLLELTAMFCRGSFFSVVIGISLPSEITQFRQLN
jgi:hypothetical protein